ncbi:hypothetical protein ACVIM9_008188 [Bradyrhizobium sp. USDA 4520]
MQRARPDWSKCSAGDRTPDGSRMARQFTAEKPEPVLFPADERLTGRAVWGATIGNILEFYDFGTYSFFAIQIGHACFPASDPLPASCCRSQPSALICDHADRAILLGSPALPIEQSRPPLSCTSMAESFGNSFTVVAVTADNVSADGPEQRIWIAFAKPSQASTLVLTAAPRRLDSGGCGHGIDGQRATNVRGT